MKADNKYCWNIQLQFLYSIWKLPLDYTQQVMKLLNFQNSVFIWYWIMTQVSDIHLGTFSLTGPLKVLTEFLSFF